MNTNRNTPHVAHNSGNNEWYTPKEYIDAAREVMGDIDLDPASCEVANKTVNAKKFYTEHENGLTKQWYGKVWLNPPYARSQILQFVKKLVNSEIEQAIVLINNATETTWFHLLLSRANAVVFPKGRVKFLMPNGTRGHPLQGQAVVYYGENVRKFITEFGKFGIVLTTVFDPAERRALGGAK